MRRVYYQNWNDHATEVAPTGWDVTGDVTVVNSSFNIPNLNSMRIIDTTVNASAELDFGEHITCGLIRWVATPVQSNAWLRMALKPAIDSTNLLDWFHLWFFNDASLRYIRMNDNKTFNSDAQFPRAKNYSAGSRQQFEVRWDFRVTNNGFDVLINEGEPAGYKLNKNITPSWFPNGVREIHFGGHSQSSGQFYIDNVEVLALT